MIFITKNHTHRNPFVPVKTSLSLTMKDIAYKKREKRLHSLLIGLPLEKTFNLFYRLYKSLPINDKAHFKLIVGPNKDIDIICDGKNLQFHSVFGRDYENGYEPETASLIDLLVGERGVFYDIGCNWGYFALYVASRSTYQGVIHAFEPTPFTFNELVDVVMQSGLVEKIKCHQIALSNQVGVGEMILPDGVHSGYATFVKNQSPKKNIVRCMMLDRLEIELPDVIKIDAEGHEDSIIEGAKEVLMNKQPMIIFENWIYKNNLEKTFQPFNILRKFGYQFYLPCFLERKGEMSFATWENANRSNDVNLAIKSFDIEERTLMPNRINCFACHEKKIEEIEHIFSTRLIQKNG